MKASKRSRNQPKIEAEMIERQDAPQPSTRNRLMTIAELRERWNTLKTQNEKRLIMIAELQERYGTDREIVREDPWCDPLRDD